MKSIEVIQGDITALAVDAVVNSAKRSLLGGSGVDGAIHKAAGPELFEYCMGLDGCEPGASVLTPGFALPAPYIIHTVAARWQGGNAGEAEILARCYKSALDLALQHNFKSVAFPAIGTGVFGFPKESAAQIAWETVKNHAFEGRILFCCFEADDFAIYSRILNRQAPEAS